MGIFGKKKKEEQEKPSDAQIYNTWLVNMGEHMKLARAEGVPSDVRAHFALDAIKWGVGAYRVYHPAPLSELEDLSLGPPLDERTAQRFGQKAFSPWILRKQFGEDFARGYKKLEENEVHKEKNDKLVNESIDLMEKLARKIREMSGLV